VVEPPPACRCHDAATLLRAEIAGQPGPPCEHTETGRTIAEHRARVQAWNVTAAEFAERHRNVVPLNSPRLADAVRAAFAGPPTPDTDTPPDAA
jgi:hypothetical protein